MIALCLACARDKCRRAVLGACCRHHQALKEPVAAITRLQALAGGAGIKEASPRGGEKPAGVSSSRGVLDLNIHRAATGGEAEAAEKVTSSALW